MSMLQAINAYNQSVDLIERFAQCLFNDSKNNTDVDLIKQLEPYIIYFIKENEMNSKRDKIFKNFVDLIDSASDKPDSDSTVKHFHEEISKVQVPLRHIKKNEKYISFLKMISEENFSDDNTEIKTVSQTVSTIDPISKLPIVEPVKNKKCGHTYEKSTILQLIEQNPRTKCPIAGCNTTEFVKKSDLIPDNVFKRMLNNINVSSQKKLKLNE